MRYDVLPTEPPAYDAPPDSLELEDGARASLDQEMQMMDFEDATTQSRSLRDRVSHYRTQFSTKVVKPVRTNVLDPLAEGYVYMSRKWESALGRIGNPLIVKRFVYVIGVALVLYGIMVSGLLPDDSSKKNGSFSDRATLEDFAIQSVDLQSMEENLEYLSSIDHVAGTAGDLSTARFVEAFFKNRGLSDVELQELPTTVNYPKSTSLKYDDTTLDITQQYNPLAKEGSATGKLIYTQYGRVADFEKLKENKIDTKDAICLMRFGVLPVSQKVLIAENYGCAAILFTSQSDAFPDSAERRGVGISEFYPGDPLTPGWSSQNAATHMTLDEATMAKIPSASLTWNQASALWNKTSKKGVEFDDGFFSGDASFEVTLDNHLVYKEEHAVWNVLAKIEGREQADHALFIGAQRDAPCKGAIFPDTGTVMLLELAQLFEKLRAKFNWEPLRSIYFLSFDATEYNLAGVTELLEINMHEVRKEAMAYMDLSDAIAGDHIEVRGSALLGGTVNAYKDEYNLTFKNQFDDYGNYVPFVAQGVPSLQVGYAGASYPKYTCEDTFENFKKSKMDPEFEKHKKLVELVLKIALHVVDDPLVPIDITSYVEQLNSDYKDLQAYTSEVQPGSRFDFSQLTVALLELKQLGKDFDMWRRAWNEILEDNAGLEPSLLSVHRWGWNSRLASLEKFFLVQEGLPGRPWYKNPVIGPQLFKPDTNDRAWWSFPGIRDAIYSGTDVQKEIGSVAALIFDGCKYFVQG